eukprot:scaffold15157_cov90-Isochrysis_galbana.AAC.2
MDRMAMHSKRCMRQMVLLNSEHTLEKLETSLELDLERAIRAQHLEAGSGAASGSLDGIAPAVANALSDTRPLSVGRPIGESRCASLSNIAEWGVEGRDLTEVVSMLERLLD